MDQTIDHLRIAQRLTDKLEILRNLPWPGDTPDEIPRLLVVLKVYRRLYGKIRRPRIVLDCTPKA